MKTSNCHDKKFSLISCWAGGHINKQRIINAIRWNEWKNEKYVEWEWGKRRKWEKSGIYLSWRYAPIRIWHVPNDAVEMKLSKLMMTCTHSHTSPYKKHTHTHIHTQTNLFILKTIDWWYSQKQRSHTRSRQKENEGGGRWGSGRKKRMKYQNIKKCKPK